MPYPSKAIQLMQTNHTLSIIIPIYNEEDNITPLIDRVYEGLTDFALPWELILVDDGSSDNSMERMEQERERRGNHIQVLELQRNYGQTAAMQAGIDHAKGTLLATLDGDLQNDPADIPRMVEKLLDEKLDLLTGWRKNRQDTLFLRKVPSRIANKIIRKVTGIDIHDYGCSLKIYRASVMKKVRLYGEMHRFIPAWVAMSVPSTRISEMVVNHSPRFSGTSSYGISRTFRVLIDLLFVWFFMRYRARPGHFFGGIGLVMGVLGSFIMISLGIDKFIMGNPIGGRPLLYVGLLMCVASLQFLTTGVLAELLSRTYFEASHRRSYLLRDESLPTSRSFFSTEQAQ